MKFVFFSANFVPHHVTLIKELVNNHGITIFSFYISEQFPYIPENIPNLVLYKKSEYTREQILNKIKEIDPRLLFVSGYNNNDFLWLAKKTKRQLHIPVVCGSDTQWYGTWKQWLRRFISPITIKSAFTHFMVGGVYQYEWARKLGFEKDEIIFNLFSADSQLLSSVDIKLKRNSYPRNFIFIGRLVETKGIISLLKAWSKIQNKNGWKLIFIGEGYLEKEIITHNDTIVKGYLIQDLLINEFNQAGCFMLSSFFEPWGLVIQEAAIAGLPIICTDVCGAAPVFVINGYNGYIIKPYSDIEIANAMRKIISMSDSELYDMSMNSRKLGNRITTDMSAASLLSVLR